MINKVVFFTSVKNQFKVQKVITKMCFTHTKVLTSTVRNMNELTMKSEIQG